MVINVDGLTLRDYLAAMAMQGFSAKYPEKWVGKDIDIAVMAYRQADAMIKVRGNG